MKNILYSIFIAVIGFIGGVIFMIYRCGYILENQRKRANKFYTYFGFLDNWLTCKEQNYSFGDYISKNNIQTVAIYGMGKIGKHLKYELEKAGIEIAYVIDEGENIIYSKETRYNLRDALPLVDLVIVTPMEEFEKIKNKILDNNKMLHVISVDEIISGK